MAETIEKDNKKKEGTVPSRRQTQNRYRKPAQKTAPSKAAAKPVSQRTTQTKGNTQQEKLPQALNRRLRAIPADITVNRTLNLLESYP